MTMKSITQHFNTVKTPQTQPIPGSNQVANSAGGFSFAVNDWARLDRFLILGSEGGSYYASEKKLTIQNAEAVKRCIKEDGLRAVAQIVKVSDEGRAPKNDQAIFALAMALKLGDEKTRKAASAAVPKVCRTGTHLMQLADAVKAFGGWGRVTARAFANWFNDQKADDVAYQVVKYASREGWSMKDLLVKSHAGAKAPSPAHKSLFSWIAHDGKLDARQIVRKEKVNGKVVEASFNYAAESREALPRIIEGVEKAKVATSAKEVVKLIQEYNLPREVLPTEHLNSVEVWDALLRAGKHGMPLTAMIRNLGKMSAIGLVSPGSEAAKYVVSRLKDGEAIAKARVHPLSILIAQRVYMQGHGEKGKLSWTAAKPVVDALDGAFYLGFKAVESTGLRYLLALDVSGSMDGGSVAGSPLTPREASVAMALVTANTEPDYHIIGYTSGATGEWKPSGSRSRGGYGGGYGVVDIDVSAKSRLKDACETVRRLPMGGTDCALPILYALHKKMPVDVFVSYTDNESWANPEMHASQALNLYRRQMGINAKLVCVGMTANQYSVADPNDAMSLDVVGFDTATPTVIAEFARGA